MRHIISKNNIRREIADDLRWVGDDESKYRLSKNSKYQNISYKGIPRISSSGYSNDSILSIHFGDVHLGISCHNCGEEFYGKWQIPYYLYEPKNDIRHPECNCDSMMFYKTDYNKIPKEARCHPDNNISLEEYKKTRLYGEYLSAEKQWKEVIDDLHFYMKPVSSEINRYLTIKTCPICGKPLILDSTNSFIYMASIQNFYNRSFYSNLIYSKCKKYIADYSKNRPDLDYAFKDISNPISFEKNAADLVQKKVEELDFSVMPLKNHPAIQKIKANSNNLSEYILELINIESDIYSLSDRLNNLYLNRLENQHKFNVENYQKKEKLYKDIDGINQRRDAFELHSKPKLEDISIPNIEYPKQPARVPVPVLPIKPTLIKPGLFNRKSVKNMNDNLINMYNSQLEKYKDDIATYDERKRTFQYEMQKYTAEVSRIDAEKERIRKEKYEIAFLAYKEREKQYFISLENAKKELAKLENSVDVSAASTIIDTEIKQAEELLGNLYKCRNQLYSYDVIYPKYRDMVTLASFYEYLVSGRCHALEGADGVYNIYEFESRANIIITQLSTIINTLNEIRDFQYKELQTITSNLQLLNAKTSVMMSSLINIDMNISKIEENTNYIAYNSAKTAYYSKLNAQLTNSLGFMIALN